MDEHAVQRMWLRVPLLIFHHAPHLCPHLLHTPQAINASMNMQCQTTGGVTPAHLAPLMAVSHEGWLPY